jgi:alanine racemase
MNSPLRVISSPESVTAFDPRRSRTWADVKLSAISHNIRALKRQVRENSPLGELIAVVKANAYGHGASAIARACVVSGLSRFAVATVTEALELRQAGISGEIFLMSAFLPEEAETIVRADIIPFISSLRQAQSLVEAARSAPFPARAFLTVDTGMGREGCLEDEAFFLWKSFYGHPTLRFSGIATHFSSVDEQDWKEPTHEQIIAFNRFLISLGEESLSAADDGRGEKGVTLSLCNSAALLRSSALPELLSATAGVRRLLFRAGLILYGIAPFPEMQEEGTSLQPALSWKARIILVRELPAGATVGYGRTSTLHRASCIATIAAGYADGVSRRLSNIGHVLYRGSRAPIVGRVSMDQLQVDLTDILASDRNHDVTGDVVTLIGEEGTERQTAYDLAKQIGTTPHESTCSLSSRVPRLYSL